MDRNRKFLKLCKLLYTGNYMKDDPLISLIDTVNFNFKHHLGYFTALRVLIVLFLQTFNTIGLIFIWQDKTGGKLRQYISVILCQQFGIVCHILLICYSRSMFNLPNLAKLYFLPLNACGKGPYRHILRQCAMTRKLYPFVFLIPIVTYFVFLPFARDQENIEFTAMFINRYTGAWSTFLLVFYKFCVISLGHSLGSVCSICLYITLHLKFQLNLLSGYLNHISCDCRRNPDDILCQDIMHRRLRSFVQAHNKFKKVSIMFLEGGQGAVVTMAVAGVFAYTSLVYFIVSDISPPSNFQFLVALLGAVFVTYLLLNSGQGLQDKSADLYTAVCRCEWIYWNVQNRRSFLMIIMNSSKVLKLNSFGILDLGHQIILKVLKVSYSMVLLLVNLNK